ncbi:hypothetical protein ES708_31238 [subsurface metagenome]
MDYQAMWGRLTRELAYLRKQGVTQIDPTLVMLFMGFIEEVELDKKEVEAR